jgi:hypothetical protein
MLAYQLARGGCGALSALFLAQAVALSVEGNHELQTYIAFYVLSGVFALSTVWLSVVIHSHKEAHRAEEIKTRPLTWGDLKRMRVPIESGTREDEMRAAKRAGRHIHTELEGNYRRVDEAIKNGYWWNVGLEGLQSGEWLTGKDLLADAAPQAYDAVAPIYVLSDAMNVEAGNHLQGGHDDFDDATVKQLRSLRSRIKMAQRELKQFFKIH